MPKKITLPPVSRGMERKVRINSAALAVATANQSEQGGPMPPRLWAVETVLAYFGGEKPINISTLYRGIRTGRYPRPINVGGARWVAEECEAALAAIIEKRNTSEHSGLGRPRSATAAA